MSGLSAQTVRAVFVVGTNFRTVAWLMVFFSFFGYVEIWPV